MHKHFSHRDHQKYDVAARESAKGFWQRRGWRVTDNPDEYGVDLIAEDGGKRFYIEVEVKRAWHGVDFKYNTMHLPARKGKFLHKPTQFMIFNNSLTHAAIFSRNVVKDSPLKEVPNCKIPVGERFYNIPVEAVTFVYTL